MVESTEQSERRGLLPRFTLKSGDTFLQSDALGDIQGIDDGLFTNDTRMLSRYELRVAGHRPSLLGAAINQRNTLFTAHLTNQPLPALGENALQAGVIHIERDRLLYSERLHERVQLTNYGPDTVHVTLQFLFAADFRDIFEVQGCVRRARGSFLEPEVDKQFARLHYRGRDDRVRRTSIAFSDAPGSLSAEAALFHIHLARGATRELFIEIETGARDLNDLPSERRYLAAAERLNAEVRTRVGLGATIETPGRLFNLWLDKSSSDLALLTTVLPTGPYPCAGIPWFATQFGRDGIIAALQTLWINPHLAAGVLRFLGATQAQESVPFRDAEPGKILHEMRRGEMAALNEVPFGRYYGSVDSTPLFVMLAAGYENRTGDQSLVDELWVQLKGAVAWIEQRLAHSRSGFLDYQSAQPSGLVNQGWKDSKDSIFHADGSFPVGPIAVVEVQGYAYAAFNCMAQLLSRRGQDNEAATLHRRACILRAAIEERFWAPELEFYGLAVDGEDRLCRVRASNAGHLLYCGVPSAERAARIIAQLRSREFSNGWGLRTLASDAPRFNPMSYHNGSVWPHDTALCAAGIARYGSRGDAVRLTSEVFEAANHFAMRLPELYCGFERIEGQTPTPYPVACLPQAWAAGAVFMLLQACLGLSIDGVRQEVHVCTPELPLGIESVMIRHLQVGDEVIDLRCHRQQRTVVVAAEKPSKIRVLVRP